MFTVWIIPSAVARNAETMIVVSEAVSCALEPLIMLPLSRHASLTGLLVAHSSASLVELSVMFFEGMLSKVP